MPAQPPETPTLYDVLGVPATASAADIRAAYRARIFEAHPDRSASPEADERARLILEAWRTLGDEQERRRYDAEVRHRRQHDRRVAATSRRRLGWAAAAAATLVALGGLFTIRESAGGRTLAPQVEDLGASADAAGRVSGMLDLDLRAVTAGEPLVVPPILAPAAETLPDMPMPRLAPLPEIPMPRLESLPDLSARTSEPGGAVAAAQVGQWNERLSQSRQRLDRLHVFHAELITRLGQYRAALDSPGLTFVQAYPVLRRIDEARVAISETEREMASYRKEIGSLELLMDDARAREQRTTR